MAHVIVRRFLLVLALWLAVPVAPASSAPPGAPPNFAALANRVAPAVVNIDVVRRVRRRIPDWYGEPEGTRIQRGVGSGFLIDPNGLIVTNSHVVQGKPELTVTLWDGRVFRGRLLGTDPLTDLALVKIDAKKLSFLSLGNSDQVQVGEWVLALGSPLGLRRSVTAGIISSTNREVSVNERIGFLQTDAAINPGNSGGPLVNMAGQVVGINTAIAAGAQGIGFAIPINSLKLIVSDLRTKGKVTRAWLGVSFAGITPELAEEFPELKGQKGLVIAQVVEGSPSDRAGLRPEDVIVAFDGKPLARARDLIEEMARHKPGDKVAITFLRAGKRRTVTVTLQTMPEQAMTSPE